jgi:acetyl-CoA carboxylase alpha subunit
MANPSLFLTSPKIRCYMATFLDFEQPIADIVEQIEEARTLGEKSGVDQSSTIRELVKKLNIPPHKLPEPLHLAHRHASTVMKKEREDGKTE